MTPTPHPSLIEFPCRFPIKVMGLTSDAFVAQMWAIACQTEPDFALEHLEQRQSKGGNYVSLTFSLWVTHQAQLDDAYRAFTSHPLVKYVL